MLFAGFNVAKGEYSLFAIVAVGSVANLVGSWLAYAVGYYGRIEWRPPAPVALHVFYYDNAGNRTAVDLAPWGMGPS